MTKKSFADKLKVLRLSPSSMKTYEQCPRKWWYTYLEKPEIVKKDWSHLIVGNFAHEVLEYFHNELKADPERDRRKLMTESCKSCEGGFKLTADMRKEVKEMLSQYLTMLDENGVPKVLSAEQKFSIKLSEGVIVTGIIDRIDELDEAIEESQAGKFHVVDYKTGKSKYLDEFQLLVYGLHLLDQNPEMMLFKGSYLALKENMKMISYTFSRTDLERIKDKILSIAQQIKEDKTWEPRPQFLCGYCDYEGICESSPKNRKGIKRPEDVAGGEIDWA